MAYSFDVELLKDLRGQQNEAMHQEEVQKRYQRAQNTFALVAGALFVCFVIMTVVGAVPYAQNHSMSALDGKLLAVGIIGMVAMPAIAIMGDMFLQKHWVSRGAYAELS